MSTLADLAARIADDLDRSDLTSQIGAAIKDAVTRYESEKFVFTEVANVTATFSSSAAFVALSALPVYFTKIDRIRIDDGASLFDLTARDYDWIMDSQDAQTLARPCEYCVYADAIQFDSRPTQNYTALIDGVKRISTASANADATGWFNDGKRLIRAWAKAELYDNVIREDGSADQANKFRMKAEVEYRDLKRKLNTRNSGRVRPTSW